MPRNGEPARQRLQQAAVELFGERGYDQTTTAEIAARAGVTERTFFRHFPDKREALFDGQAKLRTALTGAIAAAPAKLPFMEILSRAFRLVVPMLEANRPFALPRQAVIASSPALQERELAKEAALAESLAVALRQRGVDERLAALAARTGMATFRYCRGDLVRRPNGRFGSSSGPCLWRIGRAGLVVLHQKSTASPVKGRPVFQRAEFSVPKTVLLLPLQPRQHRRPTNGGFPGPNIRSVAVVIQQCQREFGLWQAQQRDSSCRRPASTNSPPRQTRWTARARRARSHAQPATELQRAGLRWSQIPA